MNIFGYSITKVQKDNAKQGFDHKHYQDCLQAVLSSARDEYQSFALDWRNRQTFILKTYMWLAVTLLASQISVFVFVLTDEKIFTEIAIKTNGFYFFAALSLIASLATFAFAIDTLRGRDSVYLSHQSPYNHFMTLAHKEASYTGDRNSMFTALINEFNHAIIENKKQISKVALKLRAMSKALICSLILSIIALLPIKSFFMD